MGRAREQEVRFTLYGVVAMMAVAALLVALAAVALGGKWHGTVSSITDSRAGASPAYVQR